MSFMDGFLRYNHIKMAPKDMTKTTFTTKWGIYCYTVIPFDLKNAGVTYQRMATALLHDMMHNEVEVYVDDMIVKSNDRGSHTINLRKFIERVKEYRLRLNPQKCNFGVTTGKLLGFIVSDKGIEVDLSKIKPYQKCLHPKVRKRLEVSWLDYNTLVDSSKLTSTCERIFELLRKNEPHTWNNEWQKAFELINDYLFHLPILVPL